ncbi:MAG: universal stress protein [Rhodospirillales bacterium]|jgi:nucleotide-binding universal stress UspA family protein|nr:universal stress protein [Rhodospirillales bacterium]
MEEHDENRFRILVCIDGSEESYRSLRYAAKMGKGVEADIVLLNVRQMDHGLRSGGLQVSVARQNMLEWGLELPGIQYLKKGADILVEVGYMASDRRAEFSHVDVAGDPVGDNKISYIGRNKRRVILKLKVAADIASGILEQWEIGHYDLIILGASKRWERKKRRSFWDPETAEKVAMHAPCPVMVARQLLVGHSHLIYTDGSEIAKEVVRRDAQFAHLTESFVAIVAVAPDVESEPEAAKHAQEAREIVESMGIDVFDTIIRVGDPVEELIEAGADHSVIVIPDTEEKGLKSLFTRKMETDLMRRARCSVMVFR